MVKEKNPEITHFFSKQFYLFLFFKDSIVDCQQTDFVPTHKPNLKTNAV